MTMRSSLRCPKCAARKIWLIEKARGPSVQEPSGQVVPVVPHQPDSEKARFFLVETVQPVGAWDLYICANCGYTEAYARDLDKLEQAPERGIRLLDAESEAGPFR